MERSQINLFKKFSISCCILPYISKHQYWRFLMTNLCSESRLTWKDNEDAYLQLSKHLILSDIIRLRSLSSILNKPNLETDQLLEIDGEQLTDRILISCMKKNQFPNFEKLIIKNLHGFYDEFRDDLTSFVKHSLPERILQIYISNGFLGTLQSQFIPSCAISVIFFDLFVHY